MTWLILWCVCYLLYIIFIWFYLEQQFVFRVIFTLTYLLEHFYQSVSASFSTLIPSIAKSTYYHSHISWWELLSLRLEPRVELDGSSELLYILLLVSIPGEVKYPTSLHWKCVTCRGLHHFESDLSYVLFIKLINTLYDIVINTG